MTTPELWDAALSQFQKAATKPVIHDLTLAGAALRLIFANDTLPAFIMPAISHLEDEIEKPDLTIYLWDTDSTNVPMAHMPFDTKDFTSRREVRGANEDGYFLTYDLYCGILSILDSQHNQAIWWIHNTSQMPDYERAAPLREILQQWFTLRGGQFIHGAALGTATGALLLTGRGGSGKSTTTLACVSDDLKFIGEDYCLLTDIDSCPTVHSVYASAKLDHHSLSLLPHLCPYIINPDRLPDEKAVLMLHPHFDICRQAPIKAILVPRVVQHVITTLKPASRAEALLALAPSTILLLSSAGQPAMQRLKYFIQRLPVYGLELGSDLHAIPDVIQNIHSGEGV